MISLLALFVLAVAISGLKLTGLLVVALVVGAIASAFVFHKNPKIQNAVVSAGDVAAADAKTVASAARKL